MSESVAFAARGRWIFRTLYGKLAAVLFGLVLLLGVLYTIWMVRTSQLYLQEVNQKLNQSCQASGSGAHSPERWAHKQGGCRRNVRTLMAINRSIEIYLLDPDGAILAFSAPLGPSPYAHQSRSD